MKTLNVKLRMKDEDYETLLRIAEAHGMPVVDFIAYATSKIGYAYLAKENK